MADSSSPLQPLKGFRDFIGITAQRRLWLINRISGICQRFGFEPLETPTLEYESLLLGKYGEEGDKLMYRFEDNGKRRVALRYDQTVPTARVIANYQSDLSFPYKRYQIQNVWRADKPQKGRYREFLQVDADIIGTKSAVADAEIIALFWSIYKDIDIPSIKLLINDRDSLIASIKNIFPDRSKTLTIIQSLDKLGKIGKDGVIDELGSKGMDENRSRELIKVLENAPTPQSLLAIITFASELGVPQEAFQFSPTLARGLDYYTGVIFEGVIPEYTVGSVGGGGRYDNLIKNLVGVEMPAIGFGLGFDRTLEAAEQLGKLPQNIATADILVTLFNDQYTSEALNLASKLRQMGIMIELYADPTIKLEKQLKYADKKQIPLVAIIGPDEAKNNTITVKYLQDRKQETITLQQLIDRLIKSD